MATMSTNCVTFSPVMEAPWHRVRKMDGSDSGNPIRVRYSKNIRAFIFSPSGDAVRFGGSDQTIQSHQESSSLLYKTMNRSSPSKNPMVRVGVDGYVVT
jgi:hypothetical protein